MRIKSVLAKPIAKYIVSKTQKWANNPHKVQKETFTYLMGVLSQTEFGKAHNIKANTTYSEFKKNIPVRDYEGLKYWFDKVANGEANVLWKDKPLYLAKTSGTTSGVKYIPITKDSIGNHINSARNALLTYIHKSQNSEFVDGKLIFLSGSPELDIKNGIYTGRLSGISNHHVPAYLKRNQVPSWETNCIEDWETKVDKIVEETWDQDLRLISGIPPWVQMYFDKLIQKTGKKVGDIFPNLQVFVYGGVNFEPYRNKIEKSIGRPIDTVELFPASEGFFAYQDAEPGEGLLLLLNDGIFYEFIPAEEYFNENPTRISIEDVELNKNYALIINSNAGLWGYSIGDTVKFVSKNPYRVVVSGRIKHYISAFGEHVIGEEVDYAMLKAVEKFGVDVVEFTVAPFVSEDKGKSFHEWFIEFGERKPQDLRAFANFLDLKMQEKNIYYRDLIEGSILLPLQIKELSKGSFIQYMKSKGKLGGQNKVPRLSNDRNMVNDILSLQS